MIYDLRLVIYERKTERKMKKTIEIDCTEEELEEILRLDERERAKALLTIARMIVLSRDLKNAGWSGNDDDEKKEEEKEAQRISEVVKRLEAIKEKLGDLRIFINYDEEWQWFNGLVKLLCLSKWSRFWYLTLKRRCEVDLKILDFVLYFLRAERRCRSVC